jgi:oxygen-independent coproporphyrinogen-3 oxidase
MINNKFGLYIHFPYCVHKCSYCDFYSIENTHSITRYVNNLCKEIDLRTEIYSEKIPVDTIFFGGGTPSLMKPHHLEIITNKIQEKFKITEDYEWTMEANPGVIDIKYFEEYKNFGVNRISFGVQSFVESELQFLERIHSPLEVFKAIEIARKTGFDNISLDLIFALPNQALSSWIYTLENALKCESNHISAYSLIYEPGTPLHDLFKQGNVSATEEDDDYELFLKADEMITDAGFEHYEVSNFAKDGKKCRHNVKYWNAEEYFAFGPSAHGYIDGKRYRNYRNNDIYFRMLENNQLPVEDFEVLTYQQKLLERIYLELRADGIRIEKFNADYEVDLQQILIPIMNKYIKIGYIIEIDGRLKLTAKGYFVSDGITLEISEIVDKFCIYV